MATLDLNLLKTFPYPQQVDGLGDKANSYAKELGLLIPTKRKDKQGEKLLSAIRKYNAKHPNHQIKEKANNGKNLFLIKNFYFFSLRRVALYLTSIKKLVGKITVSKDGKLKVPKIGERVFTTDQIKTDIKYAVNMLKFLARKLQGTQLKKSRGVRFTENGEIKTTTDKAGKTVLDKDKRTPEFRQIDQTLIDYFESRGIKFDTLKFNTEKNGELHFIPTNTLNVIVSRILRRDDKNKGRQSKLDIKDSSYIEQLDANNYFDDKYRETYEEMIKLDLLSNFRMGLPTKDDEFKSSLVNVLSRGPTKSIKGLVLTKQKEAFKQKAQAYVESHKDEVDDIKRQFDKIFVSEGVLTDQKRTEMLTKASKERAKKVKEEEREEKRAEKEAAKKKKKSKKPSSRE